MLDLVVAGIVVGVGGMVCFRDVRLDMAMRVILLRLRSPGVLDLAVDGGEIDGRRVCSTAQELENPRGTFFREARTGRTKPPLQDQALFC